MDATRALNGVAEVWAQWAVAGLIESAVLLAIVGVILLIGGRRIPAAAAYWMLLLVLVKSVLPIGIPLPLPAFQRETGSLSMEAPNQAMTANSIFDADLKSVKYPSTPAAGRVSPLARPEPGNSEAAITLTPQIVSVDLAESLSWRAAAFLCWASIIVVLLVRLIVAQRRLCRSLAFAKRVTAEELGVDPAKLAARLRITRKIIAIVAPQPTVPAVTGIRQPTLILPRGIETRLSTEQLRWVVLHELAHVRRHDLVFGGMAQLIQAITFFNPAVWLANRTAEHYRECACDELAFAHADCAPAHCAEAFLVILSSLVDQPRPAIGFYSSRGLAKRRLVRLVDQVGGGGKRWFAIGGIVAALLCAIMNIAHPHPAATANEPVRATDVLLESAELNLIPASTRVAVADAIQRIREEHSEPVTFTSATVRFRRLRLANHSKEALQQGHDLLDLSWQDALGILNSIDFVGNPNCLREARDRFLSGSLILDHPAFRQVTSTWQGEKLRVDWDRGEYLVLDGNTWIHHQPALRQVEINRGHLTEYFEVYPPQSSLEWPFRAIPLSMLRESHVLAPARVVTRLDDTTRGAERHLKIVAPVRAVTPVANSVRIMFGPSTEFSEMEWSLNADGGLDRVDAVRNHHWSRELGFTHYAGGGQIPKVRIDAECSYYQSDGRTHFGRLLSLTITVIEEAEFNRPVSPETFRAAVPANTAVWDRRGELKLRAAEQPVSDVLTLFER